MRKSRLSNWLERGASDVVHFWSPSNWVQNPMSPGGQRELSCLWRRKGDPIPACVSRVCPVKRVNPGQFVSFNGSARVSFWQRWNWAPGSGHFR